MERIRPVTCSRGLGCLTGCGAIPAMQVIFSARSGNRIDVVLKHRYALKLITAVYCLFPDLVSAYGLALPSLFRRGRDWWRTCPQFVATVSVVSIVCISAVCCEFTPVKNIRSLFCQKDMNVVLKHFANFKRTVKTVKDCRDIC